MSSRRRDGYAHGDHLSIVNTATATGTPPTGPNVTNTSSAAVTTNPAAPSITVAKSASPAALTAAQSVPGTVVTYTFKVTNTGGVTLSDVGVADTLSSPSVRANLSAITCQSLATLAGTCSGATTSLAPGQVATFTATYTLTQADVDNGSVSDSAVANGTPPGTSTPITSQRSLVTVPEVAAPSLTLKKASTTTVVTSVGQVVPYTFLVTNTGNVTLTAISVADFPGSAASGTPLTAPTCTQSSLAPNASETCTASFTVTQADLNNGSVVDTAQASGQSPTPAPTSANPHPTPPAPTSSNPSTLTIPATQAPALSIVKTASVASVSGPGAANAYTYDFAVTNTGNVTLTNVSVDDTLVLPAVGTGETLGAISCPTTTLVPETSAVGVLPVTPAGATTTCTATYTPSQGDIDNGSISDSATASGTPPSGTPVTSNPSPATVAVTDAPALSIVKSVDFSSSLSPVTSDPVTAAGQTVNYDFVVTNTGNLTLTDVMVTDVAASPSSGVVSDISCPGNAPETDVIPSLLPGVSVTCSGSYVATAADLLNKTINDTAAVSGTPPAGDGPAVTVTSNEVEVPVAAETLVKSVDPAWAFGTAADPVTAAG
jgi:uncharacterized repeat protein (TIGR01451 family)